MIMESSSRECVVLVTSSSWEEPPRIRHQVTRQLMKEYKVFWIQFPSPQSPSKLNRYDVSDNLEVIQLPKMGKWEARFWDNLPLFNKWVNKRYLKRMNDEIRQDLSENTHLITFQINFPEVAKERTYATKTYICNDSFAEHRDSYHAGLFNRYEKRIAQAVDLNLAVSTTLRDKLKQYSSEVEVFLPGHEMQVPEHVSLAESSDSMKAIYMGYVNHRINFEWIERLLNSRPSLSIEFVGPIQAKGAVDKLKAYPNFMHTDSMEGEALRSKLESANVLLMPFIEQNPTVQNMTAPNKLFQYLAAGRPIVSCRIPHLMELPAGCIYFGTDYTEFSNQIERAIQEDSTEFIQNRLEVARSNHWDDRGQQLRSRISQLFRALRA